MEVFAGLVDHLKKNGIDNQSAHSVAFMMAGLVAEIAGKPELAEYGYKRSKDKFSDNDLSTFNSREYLYDSMELDSMDGRILSANEELLKTNSYANSYWH